MPPTAACSASSGGDGRPGLFDEYGDHIVNQLQPVRIMAALEEIADPLPDRNFKGVLVRSGGVETFKEAGRRDAQCTGDRHPDGEGRQRYAPFDLRDIGRMYADAFGQLLLRQALLEPKLAQSCTELPPNLWGIQEFAHHPGPMVS